ncbi:peroxiredoxin family protein [Symbiobacterium thermophilum]
MQVVAVNPGSLASHQRWAEKNRFGFPICADEGKHVARAYGVLNALGFIARTVVLVDRNGIVRWVQPGMPATETILAAVDALGEQA